MFTGVSVKNRTNTYALSPQYMRNINFLCPSPAAYHRINVLLSEKKKLESIKIKKEIWNFHFCGFFVSRLNFFSRARSDGFHCGIRFHGNLIKSFNWFSRLFFFRQSWEQKKHVPISITMELNWSIVQALLNFEANRKFSLLWWSIQKSTIYAGIMMQKLRINHSHCEPFLLGFKSLG